MIHSFFLFKPSIFAKPSLGRGFGLVELLVSMSIMVLVAAVVLANHDRFNSGALLRSQAYEIALRIREIQTSAVSTEGLTGGDYRRLYGVFFTANDGDSNTSDDRTRFFTFSVTKPVSSGSPLSASKTGVGAPGVLDDRFEITCIQVFLSDGITPGCRNSSNGVYILFQRPNYDALFYRQNNSPFNNNTSVGQPVYTTKIVITVGARGSSDSRDIDNERTITITRAGQITVQ